MTAAVTLLCLVACPVEPPILFEEVYEEWNTHLPATTYTLEPQAVFTPRREKWSPAVEGFRPLVAGQFPPEQVETALCVIHGESRGVPTADNPTSTARGLWQFLKGTWDMVAEKTDGPDYDSGAPYSPEISTFYAAWLWRELGWSQWNAYAGCR